MPDDIDADVLRRFMQAIGRCSGRKVKQRAFVFFVTFVANRLSCSSWLIGLRGLGG